MAKQKIKIISANIKKTGRGGKAPTKIATARQSISVKLNVRSGGKAITKKGKAPKRIAMARRRGGKGAKRKA